MTKIPEQEEKLYSEADMEHLLARKMAAKQLEFLETKVNRNEMKTAEVFTEIRQSLDKVNHSLQNRRQDLAACRVELKKEMSEEYVTVKIFDIEIDRIRDMVKSQWKTITVAVSVALIALQIIFKVMGL